MLYRILTMYTYDLVYLLSRLSNDKTVSNKKVDQHGKKYQRRNLAKFEKTGALLCLRRWAWFDLWSFLFYLYGVEKYTLKKQRINAFGMNSNDSLDSETNQYPHPENSKGCRQVIFHLSLAYPPIIWANHKTRLGKFGKIGYFGKS